MVTRKSLWRGLWEVVTQEPEIDLGKIYIPPKFSGMSEEDIENCIRRPVRDLAVRLAPALRKAVANDPKLLEEVRSAFQDFNIPGWPMDLES